MRTIKKKVYHIIHLGIIGNLDSILITIILLQGLELRALIQLMITEISK